MKAKEMDLKASREIGKSGEIAKICLIMWLRRVSSSLLDSSIKFENAKRPTLAALFLKRPDKVDEVLKKINYNDDDLMYLTEYRPELAESHEGFFKAIDKIKDPENQEQAVMIGVINLFNAKKHDSVIPLINALEKRQFNGRNLKNVAIQKHFIEGASRGIKDIVEEFHEHPAITSKEYADGLIGSWDNDKSSQSFTFLLAQADQSDLAEAKQM